MTKTDIKRAFRKFRPTGKHFSAKEYLMWEQFTDEERIEFSEICANCGCPKGEHYGNDNCDPDRSIVKPRKVKALSANELRKRAFRKFLHDNDALEAWYRNTRTLNHRSLINETFKCDPESYISSAFGWSSSPEGYDYWLRLSVKWRARLDKM